MRSALGNAGRFLFRLSTAGFQKRFPLTRYSGYKQILSHKANQQGMVLSISHSEILAKLLGFLDSQIIDVSYPEYDLINLPYADYYFNALVADQVLEHIAGDPFQAMAESFRVVKTGGLVLHTSTFFNRVHGKNDFWRFSPTALRLMVGCHGEIIDSGGWGNLAAYFLMNLGLNSELIPESRIHPANWIATRNHKKYPIFTWVLARKC